MTELEKFNLLLQGGYNPMGGAITTNQMEDFKTAALFNQIQDTNNLISSLNIPNNPNPVPNTADEDLLKKQKRANMLIAFGDLLRGKDATAGFTQRQAMFDAERERAERQAKLQNIIQNSDAIPDSLKQVAELFPEIALKNIFSQSGSSGTVERFGVYNNTGELVGTVNKADINKINEIENNPNLTLGQIRSKTLQKENQENLEYFSVSDQYGNRVKTVVNPSRQEVEQLNQNGFLLNRLPTPTDRGVGNKKDDTYDNLKDKFKKTNTLISTLDGMAKQFYNNPESALAIGGGVKFIDSVIKNIDAAGNMLSGKEYETMKDKGFISSDGTDYSTILEDVSTNTGISASRVRDLAYLFAAARGQEGRGLSDKDYENALSIVSGGVGAKGKIAVLNDVAKRMYGEAIGDLNFEISNLPSNADVEPFERLRGSLSTFQNPYSINSQEIIQNTETDDPLKIR